METLDIIARVFAEQWVFMLIAVVAVVLTFLVKKLAPDFYETFLKGALIILSVMLIILALIFKAQDLFLLIPIIVICCEMFGYTVTGRIVGVLFVDFILIQLDFRIIAGINETLMNVIFFVLQVAAAVCIGLIMDRYIREKNEQHGEKEESGVEKADTSEAADTENTETDYDSLVREIEAPLKILTKGSAFGNRKGSALDPQAFEKA